MVGHFIYPRGLYRLTCGFQGSWLLDQRLMHRKLEVEVSGTKSLDCFRNGQLEGCKGYTVVTTPIRRQRSADIFVKIDSVDSTPMTRIPIRYLWPKNSTFPPACRVVVRGATIDGNETHIGEYGVVYNSTYELTYNVRCIYILPSGPFEYFDTISLCSSGAKVEWMGYTY